MQSSTRSLSPGDFETMAARTKNRQPRRDEGRFKTVTLQDVAQVAGVTSMTVSRVIKGTEGVSQATRERVLRIAQELGYTANLSARALATGETRTIAVISGALDQYYYANIVHRLESHLTSSGYQMRLLHTHNDLEHLITSTNASAVDGIIIAGKYHLVEEFRARAPQAFHTCVFIDTLPHSEADHIYSNLAPAIEEALLLMLGANCRRIAYVVHFDQYSPSSPTVSEAQQMSHFYAHEQRLQTYLSVMQRAKCAPELIGARPGFDFTPGALAQYLAQNGCPDALVCVNDETAMYVYRVLRDAGYRIPDDVLLVGCDGLPLMACFDPPLSTIAQPLEEICALAWQFLQTRITDPTCPVQQATFDARLLVRKSLQPN